MAVKHRMQTSTRSIPCGVNPRFSVPKIELPAFSIWYRVYEDWKKDEARGGVYWGSPIVDTEKAARKMVEARLDQYSGNSHVPPR